MPKLTEWLHYMAWDLKTRQYLSFSTFLGLTAILTIAAYWLLCPQWVYFRRGENYFFAHEFARAIPVYQEAVAAGLKRPEARPLQRFRSEVG